MGNVFEHLDGSWVNNRKDNTINTNTTIFKK